jgi:hypothetical protein
MSFETDTRKEMTQGTLQLDNKLMGSDRNTERNLEVRRFRIIINDNKKIHIS